MFEDPAKSKKGQPADVTDFPKGKKPQQRSKPKAPPQKPKAKKPEKPKAPVLGQAFKAATVKGVVQVERRTDPERKLDIPTGDRNDESPAAAESKGGSKAA